MSEAKIQFSSAEMELMQNAEVILTKNIVMQKVKILFEVLQTRMVEHLPLFDLATANSPKISKGENYNGLPYLMLDYPREFGENIFAIRTMFWWGNFFSSTLHIKGVEKQSHLKQIQASYKLFKEKGFYIGVGENQWEHHFEITNYKLINDLTEEEYVNKCDQYDHIKIAAKHTLENVHNAATELFENWKMYLKIISKHPNGEKDL